MVLPIAEGQTEYAQSIVDRCEELGLRAELSSADSKINYRIREAEVHKIPYMLVVGKREVAESTVSVRTYQEKDRGSMTVDAVLAEIAQKTKQRALDVTIRDYSALFRSEDEGEEAAGY
jgi:threonyl-tRNA synthetase